MTMRNFYKLQIRNGSTGVNHVDEVLKDSRITSHIDYAGIAFERLNKGDLLLIHKGSNPHCLVEILYKITNKKEIIGVDFGVNYKVKILSFYKELDNLLDIKASSFKVGHNGTFFPLNNDTKTLRFVQKWFGYIQDKKDMKEHIELLQYKKQIILQGPPGTGKTRLAKLIAQNIMRPDIIDVSDILSSIHVDQKIHTISDRASFTITGFTNRAVNYRRERTGKEFSVSFVDIQKGYETKVWNNVKNGSDTYAAGVSKFIFDNYKSDRFELIQFHPAFTYEDFVRGITAKTKGISIEYKTEDKIFGKLAQQALTNYNDSKKSDKDYSELKWLDAQFDLFREKVREIIDKDGFYELTPNVSIVDIDENAFRYVGDTWRNENHHRMRFSDIKAAYLSGNGTRQELKHNPLVSRSAFQHATYYFKVLSDFKTQMPAKPANAPVLQHKELKYVLIIDEINRANLPSVLGELIYALEYRGEKVKSMYDIDGDSDLVIPPNLYIIGTMNTADRSVGHIDYAIRRRFAFVDILPDESVITNQKARELFNEIALLFWHKGMLASDFKPDQVQLGHSYFMVEDDTELDMRAKYEIFPILEEYLKDGILLEKAEIIINELKARFAY